MTIYFSSSPNEGINIGDSVFWIAATSGVLIEMCCSSSCSLPAFVISRLFCSVDAVPFNAFLDEYPPPIYLRLLPMTWTFVISSFRFLEQHTSTNISINRTMRLAPPMTIILIGNVLTPYPSIANLNCYLSHFFAKSFIFPTHFFGAFAHLAEDISPVLTSLKLT